MFWFDTETAGSVSNYYSSIVIEPLLFLPTASISSPLAAICLVIDLRFLGLETEEL